MATAVCAGVIANPKAAVADTVKSDGIDLSVREIGLLMEKVAASASESVASAMGRYLTGKNLDSSNADAIVRKIRQDRTRITRAARRGTSAAFKEFAKTRRLPSYLSKRLENQIGKETTQLVKDLRDPQFRQQVFAGFSQVVDIGTKRQGSVNDVIRQRFLDHLSNQARALLAPPPKIAVRQSKKKKRVVRKKIRKKKIIRKRRKSVRKAKQRRRVKNTRRNTRRRSVFDIGPRSGNFSAGRIQF